MLSDKNQLAQFLSLMVGASLPVPSLRTCTNSPQMNESSNVLDLQTPCLNAPPIPAPAQTDYQFAVTAQGSSTSVVTRTLTWVDNTVPTAPITNSARLSGNWFVETQTIGISMSVPIQTLTTHRVDWAGTPWITELLPDPTTGNPMFASVKGSGQQAYSFDVTTCATDHTCTLTDTIQFVGADGKNYTAKLVPPPLPLVEATVVTTNPQVGDTVTFDASGSHSPVGLPVTVTWQFPQPDTTCLVSSASPDPSCIDGIRYTSPVTGTQATYSFSDIGTYNVLVTAVDPSGESATLSLPVTVSPSAAQAPHITVAPACPVASGSCNVFMTVPGQPTTLHGAIAHTYHSVGDLNEAIDWGDGTQTSGYSAIYNQSPLGCGGLGCPPLTSTDAFTVTHSYTATGTYSVTVSDSGPYGATSVTTTERVGKAATSTTLASSATTVTAGQPITFTAMIAAMPPGVGTPTGSVTFKDGTTTLGPGSLSTSGGVTSATVSTSGLAVGPHTITASYGGDSGFLSSAAGPLTQYVNTKLSGYPTLSNGAYNLSNANLSGGYFVGASLAGASLSGSNLTGAVFLGANLSGANLSNSNYMAGATFTNANLTNANLSNSNLKGANFTGVNLTGANLSNSNLKGASGLKTATLTNVVWSKTTCPDGTNSSTDGGTCLGHL
jgi:hypothetical protein